MVDISLYMYIFDIDERDRTAYARVADALTRASQHGFSKEQSARAIAYQHDRFVPGHIGIRSQTPRLGVTLTLGGTGAEETDIGALCASVRALQPYIRLAAERCFYRRESSSVLFHVRGVPPPAEPNVYCGTRWFLDHWLSPVMEDFGSRTGRALSPWHQTVVSGNGKYATRSLATAYLCTLGPGQGFLGNVVAKSLRGPPTHPPNQEDLSDGIDLDLFADPSSWSPRHISGSGTTFIRTNPIRATYK